MHPPIHAKAIGDSGLIGLEIQYATGSEWIYWFGDIPIARGRSYSFEFSDIVAKPGVGAGDALLAARLHFRQTFGVAFARSDAVKRTPGRVPATHTPHAAFAAETGWTLFATLARIGHGIADAKRAKDIFFDRRRRISLLDGEKSDEYKHAAQDYQIAVNLHNKLEGLMYAAQGIALSVQEAANLLADAERDQEKDQKHGPCHCRIPGSCPLCGGKEVSA